MPEKMPKAPAPPKGYQMEGSVHLPPNAKMSPDIEDRRSWGPVRQAAGQQGQDFRDFWKDFRRTYPDIHTAYETVRDTILGKPAPSKPPALNQPIYVAGASQVAAPKIGETKKFANGTIGVWDGHGWTQK